MTNQEQRDRALRIIREIADMISHTSEGIAQASALKQAATILERESESCKFDCRNEKEAAKEGYSAGFEAAKLLYHPDNL